MAGRAGNTPIRGSAVQGTTRYFFLPGSFTCRCYKCDKVFLGAVSSIFCAECFDARGKVVNYYCEKGLSPMAAKLTIARLTTREIEGMISLISDEEFLRKLEFKR